MSQNKGFTLIELLVVIAIIGILAAAALASLGTARTKGQVAAVKSQLSNLRAQAELYYTSNTGTGVNSGYGPGTAACNGGMFNIAASATPAPGLQQLLQGVASSSGGSIALPGTLISCGSTTSAWAVAVQLPGTGNGFYCVDSTGRATDRSTTGVVYTALTGALGTGAVLAAGGTVCN